VSSPARRSRRSRRRLSIDADTLGLRSSRGCPTGHERTAAKIVDGKVRFSGAQGLKKPEMESGRGRERL
jgi:hypothetical protein